MKYARIAFLLAALSGLSGCSGSSNSNVVPPGSGPASVPIGQIQGTGKNSPMDNASVTVAGIVSGDFQDDADRRNNLAGFFIQSLEADSNPSTSEGVFIFDGRSPAVDVAVGDLVVVEGTVNEHFDETQISAALVTVTGRGVPQAVAVSLPANLEHYEGMLISLPQTLSVASLYELERFGTVQLFAGERAYAYTNQSLPDVAGYVAHQEYFAAHSLLLDDGRVEQSLDPIRYLNAGTRSDYSIRSGDTVAGLTGNLRFARGSGTSGAAAYRLVPTVEPLFQSANPRPGAPVRTGSLRVAGFNTLNFFSTIDFGQNNCGPSGSGGCRGADSAAELERQLSKLVSALQAIDADIVGLMEVENNAGIALQLLVDRLNNLGAGNYAYVDTGFVGTDVISNALLYKTTTVSPNGDVAILDSRIDIRFDETRSRPSIAQSFRQTSNGAMLSVVVNHLKSKGSACDDAGDPDLNDGQGNCNATRTTAAMALADWIAADATGSDDSDYLVIGDLNAFVYEEPLSALKRAGLVNLLEQANSGDFWTSIFAGESGALDHALATSSLLPQVRQALVWHVNADEPVALDYNMEFARSPALFDAGSPYRTSDHDPIIVDLNLAP